ncbi:MAG: nucleotide exchange factor GrpE [Candidatus Peribacteria bacterium]|jgi:molecular chaperone GrpE|nr:nucleotide exchange factor GrpE [Candidatus Peribacteria bacterium]
MISTKKSPPKSHHDAEIQRLQSLLQEKEEITKKAQLDYINLKTDFDFLVRQTQQKKQSLHQEILIRVVKKLLPFVEDLRKSLIHLTDQQKADPLGEGVQIIYNKFISALAEFQVFPIESEGLEPDTFFHEPVSIQPTENKKLKGRIIQIFEQGFYYKNGEEKMVILPSKVVIGS